MAMSEEQRKAASERMKAMHAAKNSQTKTPPTQNDDAGEEATAPQPTMVSIDANVLQDIMARLSQVEDQTPPVNQNLQQPQTVSVGRNSVVTKYPIDPTYYPDPTPMLFQEPTLQRFSPAMNYRFSWKVQGQVYEAGRDGMLGNVREPIFTVTMYRVDFDEDGKPLEQAFRLRRLQLTEDETTMAMIAQELGLDMNTTPLKDLMDVARYHRIRQWVLEYFYPPKFDQGTGITEMVDPVSGRVVQVENIARLL